MITQEDFDLVSEHIIRSMSLTDHGAHLFSPSAFGDECTLDEVYAAFEDGGYEPEYCGDVVRVVL